ncbi:MAG: hypothetical protein IJT83_08015 [Victivallales bacterium]|nr:hypothetical protein [Victivallales bacterium]
MDRQVRPQIGDRGSIALEYVVMLSFGVVFVCIFLQVFEPGRGYTEDIGKPLVAYFQSLLVAISLPVP